MYLTQPFWHLVVTLHWMKMPCDFTMSLTLTISHSPLYVYIDIAISNCPDGWDCKRKKALHCWTKDLIKVINIQEHPSCKSTHTHKHRAGDKIVAITVSLDNHHDDDYTTNDNVMNFPTQVSRASVFSHNPSRPKDTIKTKKVK